MSYSYSTDVNVTDVEGDASKRSQVHAVGFAKNTKVQEERSSSYDLAYGKSDPEEPPMKLVPRGVRGPAVPSQSQGARDFSRRVLQKATESASELVAASDPVAKANAGFDLLETLEALWALRQLREPDWGDLVNILQTVLSATDLEALSAAQCTAVKRVICDELAGVPMDGEEMSRALDILHSAGFDPWVGISGDPSGQE